MSELIQYTKQEVKELFNLSDAQLRGFSVTQKTLQNKGIYLRKEGRGEKAVYTLEKIIDEPNKISDGIIIDGVQWPEMTLRFARDLTNMKFGKLTPLFRTVDYKYHSNKKQDPAVQWVCKCDCGQYTVALTKQMVTGRKRSCGCLFEAHDWRCHMFEDLTGQNFGKLTVIKYMGLHPTRKNSQWLCKCECGNEKITTTADLKKGITTSCGCLRSSFGELQIETILQKNNINYKKEYHFKDLLSEKNNPLRFDFAIFDSNNCLNYLIEYDGEQHYSTQSDKIWKDNFQIRQYRDKIKNQYCIQHNIKLYRIPYWDKLKIKELEDLIQEKYLVKE